MSKQIPIIVINLKKNTHKKNRMITMLNKLNVEYSFLEAVYGNGLSDKALNQIYNPKHSIDKKVKILVKNEIGCALSHFNIYQQMLDNNIDKMIVLEDDTIIGQDFIEALKVIKFLPKNWELFLLGYAANTKDSILCNVNVPLLNNPTAFKVGVPLKRAGGTYGYIINQSGAKKLLTYKNTLYQAIDLYTCNRHFVNIYVLTPRVVSVDYNFDSDIDDDRVQAILGSKPKFKKRINQTEVYKALRDFNENRKLKRTWTLGCIISKLKFRIKYLFKKCYE